MKRKVFFTVVCFLLIQTGLKAQKIDTTAVIEEMKRIQSSRFSLIGTKSMDNTLIASMFKIQFLRNKQVIVNQEELKEFYTFGSTISIEKYSELFRIFKASKKRLTLYIPVVNHIIRSNKMEAKASSIDWRTKESLIIEETSEEIKIISSPILMNFTAVNVQ